MKVLADEALILLSGVTDADDDGDIDCDGGVDGLIVIVTLTVEVSV